LRSYVTGRLHIAPTAPLKAAGCDRIASRGHTTAFQHAGSGPSHARHNLLTGFER
jgi:hypothetical protein